MAGEEYRVSLLTRKAIKRKTLRVIGITCSVFFFFLATVSAFAEELSLQALIDEALKNNREINMLDSRASAAGFRVPQAKSLPDPMFMVGYQNDGTRSLYTWGQDMAVDSQWMFTASQMLPFPGKLALKEAMALRDAEGIAAQKEALKLKTVARVKELYFDLFLTYRGIKLLTDKTALFSRIEDAALARYSSGMGMQQEVLMAQTEKYMLLEKEEMLKQKIQSIEAMLNAVIGRAANTPLGVPAEPTKTVYNLDVEESVRKAFENSPEITAKNRMIAAAEAKVQMAKKEYYPDFTVNATYALKGPQFPDMWILSTAINIPIFYKTKQRAAVSEAEALRSESENDLEGTKIMMASAVRDNYSMLITSEKLMELYKSGLIPKTYQDFELAISGYVAGKVEAITVISRLKSLIDLELLYWNQFIEREKAVARLEAITGGRK